MFNMVSQCRRAAWGAVFVCLAASANAQDTDWVAEEAASARPGDGFEQQVTSVSGSGELAAAEPKPPAIDLSVAYSAEVMSNVRSGFAREKRYLDNLDVTLTVDAERALGWRGVSLFTSALYNNGEPFSDDLVGAAQGVSNIETGVRSLGLYEAWIEQRFVGDRASVKIGLYDLNSEFDAIHAASLFINPSHGIGPDFSQPGRNGPSIFPVTSLAVRSDYKISDRWLVRAAILDGVRVDPDRPSRTAVRLAGDDGALSVLELNYAYDRTRIGAGYWRYTEKFKTFSAEHLGSRGNDGAYAFFERRLTQESGDVDQGLAGWVRVGFADADVNPVEWYLGGGIIYRGPFAGRDKDQVGLAIGWARFGNPFRRSSAGAGDHLEPQEVIIEATYRAPVTSWLTLQPDIQYVVDPGGRPSTANALILGLRADLGF